MSLQKKDIIGIAQTGTGKTASFVLPMLTLLESGRARARMPRTLILEPTRELAAQVARELREIRQEPPPLGGAADRRRVVRRPEQEARPRRRRADRHARPHARPVRARPHPADRRRDPRHRRGRPHARHGLHPRHRAHLRPAAAAPADAVLLGDHAARDPAADQPLPRATRSRSRSRARTRRPRPSTSSWCRSPASPRKSARRCAS